MQILGSKLITFLVQLIHTERFSPQTWLASSPWPLRKKITYRFGKDPLITNVWKCATMGAFINVFSLKSFNTKLKGNLTNLHIWLQFPTSRKLSVSWNMHGLWNQTNLGWKSSYTPNWFFFFWFLISLRLSFLMENRNSLFSCWFFLLLLFCVCECMSVKMRYFYVAQEEPSRTPGT